MEISYRLQQKAKNIEGIEQLPYKACKFFCQGFYLLVSYAFEIIPKTLADNCGVNVIKIVTALRQKHAEENGVSYGIDGNKGVIANMEEVGVWEPIEVKV